VSVSACVIAGVIKGGGRGAAFGAKGLAICQ